MLQDQPASFGATYEEEALCPDERWRTYLIEAEVEKRTILRFFEKDQHIIGMAGVKVGSTPKTKHRATLFFVYVRPAERGNGIAKALINVLIERLKIKGVDKVDLVVNVMQKSAIALYQSLGFAPEGCLKNFWCSNGEYDDVYSMGKLIETTT
jgi:ribosomal protein S18 acetylase RimI-like enzyme